GDPKECFMSSSLLSAACVLTELDHARLSGLPSVQQGHALTQLLADAERVPSSRVPSDVVTLYSMVLLRESDGLRTHRFVLCYPDDAEPQSGFISVLSSLGQALLGRRIGEALRGTLPSGEERVFVIEALLFQPEASGDFTS